jgi:hypothetical protein
MVNSEELIGTIQYLMQQTGRRINRRLYNRVRLYFTPFMFG